MCLGQNYAAHAAESADPPPERPILFLKTPNTVVGPFDDVEIPPGSTKTDWEVELALRPYLVPAAELDHAGLRLGSTVNGEPRQDSSTADMIFDVPYLIWHISQFLTLEPGDIVNTGTPHGVALSGRFPYLKDGDEMTMTVEGIGQQRQWARQR